MLYEHLRRTEPILRDTSDGALRSLMALDDEIIESSQSPEHLQHCEWLRSYLEKIPTQLGRGIHELKRLLWGVVDYGSVYLTNGWQQVDGMVLPTQVQEVPQWGIKYYYEQGRAVCYFDDSNIAPHGIEFTGNQAIKVRIDARDPWRPYGWGVISSCYRHLYLYNFIYALAAEGMERHDLPWILVKVPEGARAWADDIVDSDTRIAGMVIAETPPVTIDAANPLAMPDTDINQYQVEFKEMSRATHEIFIPWLSRLEASISYAYTSQTLSTQQSTDGAGSFAQSQTHADSRARSEAGWALYIEQGVQTLVDRIWKFNWPGELPPRFHIITEPEAAVDSALVDVALRVADRRDSNGVPLVSAEWLRGLIQAPEPQPGEPTVEPVAVPSVSPFGFAALEGQKFTVESDRAEAESTAKRIIKASSEYAVQTARRVMPPIRTGLEKLASVYRGPKTTKEQIDARLKPLQEALAKAVETGNLTDVRKAGFDLIPLADVITSAVASMWLAGRAAEDIKTYQLMYADALTSHGMQLAAGPDEIRIQVEDAALRDYLTALNNGKLHYPLTDEQWSLASAAIRRYGVKYASQVGIKLSDDLNRMLTRAVDEGLTQEQFNQALYSQWAAAGIEAASPHYLEMVLRTTSAQSYGQGQAALARSESVDPYVWGYQMIANPGLSPHHLYHYPEMHEFAAPKEHQAWIDGWGPGCDYNCGCMRRTIMVREAERRGWLGEQEPVKPYVGQPPTLPQPVYGF